MNLPAICNYPPSSEHTGKPYKTCKKTVRIITPLIFWIQYPYTHNIPLKLLNIRLGNSYSLLHSRSLAASRHIELPGIQPQPHISFKIAADMIAYEGQIDFNIWCKIPTINSSSANNWQFSLFLRTIPFLYLWKNSISMRNKIFLKILTPFLIERNLKLKIQ